MNLALAVMSLALQAAPEPEVRTRFGELEPSCEPRAIVLVHGLLPRFWSNEKVKQPISPSWQSAGSGIGRALSEHGSLFAFSYSQNVPVERIPQRLVPHVAALKEKGYDEIVLIGFSAGALIVRQFVEDHPRAGITRVIQVCPPNGGTAWGKWECAVRENQEVFIRSMTWEARKTFLDERAERGVRIPSNVEFTVVMGTFAGMGDTLASRESQWPEDLREQGIPVVAVTAVHCLAMRSDACASVIGRLASTPRKRWTEEKVEKAKDELLD